MNKPVKDMTQIEIMRILLFQIMDYSDNEEISDGNGNYHEIDDFFDKIGQLHVDTE